MRKAASKALYLFLCAILGMVLFTMLHRSIFVLYDILLFSDFNTYSFGLSSFAISMIDFVTMLGALFLGGWYGTLLGIDWYALVYGPSANNVGLFHGFLPHHWRNKSGKKSSQAARQSAPTTTSTVVNVPVEQKIKEWSFDDFITPKVEPKKRVAVKRSAARKTGRKTAAKRVTKTTVS